MNIWYVYEACMSSAPTESLALQHVKLSDMLKIHNGMIFGFCPGNCHVKDNSQKNVNKFLQFRSMHKLFLTVNGYNMDKHLESS